MLSKPIPAWILIGGFLLAGIAGCVNAMGFLGLHHQALSHMSGTATIISTDLARGELSLAAHAALVLAWFFLGCVLSAVIIRQSVLQAGRRYGVALMIEAVLLAGAALLLRQGANAGDYLAAVACGLQNALATTYSGAVIRTTHVTGILTDLGIAAGLGLRGEPVDLRRVTLHLILFAGFLAGGIVGGAAFLRFSYDALFGPAALTGLAGAAYALHRHYRLIRAT
ncbi:MAG: hypothetical protein RIS54_643 [Verrucomicrobiota bacterium]|jgi:uncharacterized membrane protein YoaK (UPF0700 family)